MRRRGLLTLLGAVIVQRSRCGWAEQPGERRTIGYLSPGSPSHLPKLQSIFVEGLHSRGWIEGKNLIVERRYAEDRIERLPALAEELVGLKVELIASGGTLAPLAAKRATTTIPIVLTSAGDPVGSGLVASLARPGGNVTGLSLMAPDLGGKRLQLLKELAPAISRTAVIWNAANPYSASVFKETVEAAPTLGIAIQSLEVRRPGDFDAALDAAAAGRADALLAVEDPLTTAFRDKIVAFAAANRLPAMYGVREFTEAGGIMSYGPDLADLFRRSADYVDKILNGARPADLPVEQPTKFELVINLKTARALGLAVPPALLARADEVIE